jgi:hypothetical protein
MGITLCATSQFVTVTYWDAWAGGAKGVLGMDRHGFGASAVAIRVRPFVRALTVAQIG